MGRLLYFVKIQRVHLQLKASVPTGVTISRVWVQRTRDFLGRLFLEPRKQTVSSRFPSVAHKMDQKAALAVKLLVELGVKVICHLPSFRSFQCEPGAGYR
jgi:hypothetical protein